MMNRTILTVIGLDRPGIVAAVSEAVYHAGCSIEDATMLRLGGHFTIMLVLRYPGDLGAVEAALMPAAKALELRIHLDPIGPPDVVSEAPPNCRVTVFGADHPGIVAHVTRALAEIGFNIVDLESQVSGRVDRPIYIMIIEGYAPGGMEAVGAALDPVHAQEQVEVRVSSVETTVF